MVLSLVMAACGPAEVEEEEEEEEAVTEEEEEAVVEEEEEEKVEIVSPEKPEYGGTIYIASTRDIQNFAAIETC
jgi:hypothetical protein